MSNGDEIRYVDIDLPQNLTHIELYALSDVHYGSRFCDAKLFQRQLDYIVATPEAYVILNGDLCESVTRSSVGDVYGQRFTPQEQRDWCIKALMPIKSKVLGMTTGNHENRIYKECGVDISSDIAVALGCYYDPDGVYCVAHFGGGAYFMPHRKYTYGIYAMHGYGGARTRGAKALKLERMGMHVTADIYIQSHDHEVMTFPLVFLQPAERQCKVVDGHKTGLMVATSASLVKSNAYLKWNGYARSGGFPPVDLVTPTIWLGGEVKPWPGMKSPSMEHRPEARVVS